ncbi:alpha/beta fold hydrolase [Novosphingobium sp. PP1Y]|uniref:alpha/beta fold hydrolase n=1 Tax=Novosphingobium sp. PP1Y TaxID=702113 RepID=UPI00020EF36A|nr:alpha/beta hydrolase [Novosphingobium sp. PP1Y]CCA94013.1 2-hydroxymuconic semialdehyde hydrolase [Novosphingobium sp. PP1Y]
MDQAKSFDPADPVAGLSVVAGGLRTHYIELGEGDPIILLHGSGPGVSAWENWAQVLPVMARYRRVIAIDIPGFGSTERKADGQYDMDFWVGHLFAFMDALNLAAVPLVGNSFGGMVAMAASLRDPARVSGMVLMGSAAGDVPMSEAHKLASVYDGSIEKLQEILRIFPFDPAQLTPEMLKRRHAQSIDPEAKKNPHPVPVVENDQGEKVFRTTPEEELGAITTPTLILHGRDDRVLPVELAMRVHRAIKTSQLHTFGNCGHWVQLERLDDFVQQTVLFAAEL